MTDNESRQQKLDTVTGNLTRVLFAHEVHGFAIRPHEVIMAFDSENDRLLFEKWWNEEGQTQFLNRHPRQGPALSALREHLDDLVTCPECARVDLPSYQCWRVGHLQSEKT